MDLRYFVEDVCKLGNIIKKHDMKKDVKLIIAFLAFLVLIGILIFATCWTNETKSLISQYAGIFVTGIGFIIAIYQLRLSTNQYFDDLEKKKKDFLDLIIATKTLDEYNSIKTQVVNKSGEDKEIDYSFLLITKQEDNIIQTLQTAIEYFNLNLKINSTNDFNKIKNDILEPSFINNSIGIVPLEFYFSENIGIGNENPCYTYSFNNDKIKLQEGIYSVRFFIYPKEGYHRSTVESLIIK
jgi:cell division protein FtsL